MSSILSFLRQRGAYVLIAVLALGALIPAASAGAAHERRTFDLVLANPKLLQCIAQDPNDPTNPPTASVTVTRGDLNDNLALTVKHFKPGLKFDMFTVQRSNKLADGSPDPSFKGSFGLAWYQSDVQVGDDGESTTRINTVLLDQIFGFDPDVSLSPINTFHVGFWFNSPDDARPCLGHLTPVTPFNGDHTAGPLAFISTPNADTQLGPLCVNPDFSKTPVACNP
jgi:hypothetical protein